MPDTDRAFARCDICGAKFQTAGCEPDMVDGQAGSHLASHRSSCSQDAPNTNDPDADYSEG